MTWLFVAVGAALGAPARFLLDTAVSRRIGRPQPWGTLAVNLSGCFALGLVAGAHVHGLIGSAWLALLGTGFCGAYTTFSTFVWETAALVEDGEPGWAAGNALVSVLAGIGLAVAGYALT